MARQYMLKAHFIIDLRVHDFKILFSILIIFKKNLFMPIIRKSIFAKEAAEEAEERYLDYI